VCIALTLATSRQTQAAETVVVDASAQYQVMEGWGTSLCWWANVVGGWSDAKREAIADLLFDPVKGLGLNLVRYNIGGGDAPDHKHMRVGGAVPGYKAAAEAPYDWSADANQRWMLQAAIARGANLTEAFANSPPWWMTKSGCSAGAQDPNQSNLRDDCCDDFAAYLADVVAHFRDAWGAPFGTLDPLNEPGGNWWQAEKGQEGCRFDAPSQARLLNALAAALKERGLPTEISAPDAHSFDWLAGHVNGWDDEARAAVARLNVHAYNGQQRAEVRNLAERLGNRLWMSEVDHAGRTTGHEHDHDSMAPALTLAEAIVRDLRDLQPQAWVFWQAIENEQYCLWWKFNYGLLHGDFMHGTEAYDFTRKYHALGQFTKFVRPGYQMIDTGAEDAVAFVDWRSGALALVSFHRGDAPRARCYDLGTLRLGKDAAERYRTAEGESLKRLPEVRVTKGALVVTEKERSITTYVLNVVSYAGPLKLNDTAQTAGPNRFEFVGDWAFKGREPLAFTRDNHWGWRNDDCYLVRFRGTQAKLYAARDKSDGLAAFSVDGGPETVVDLYSPTRQDQALLYASPRLPVGDHVVKVRVTGEKNAEASQPVVPADRADIYP